MRRSLCWGLLGEEKRVQWEEEREGRRRRKKWLAVIAMIKGERRGDAVMVVGILFCERGRKS